MLEGIDVYSKAWYKIMGVFRTIYNWWMVNANNGMRADQHGNVRMAKSQIHTLQATATLHLMLEWLVDHMPQKTRTLEIGEKIVSKCLLSS